MTTHYFTSNAATGAGSLVEAIRNASSGDVVRPDETVFERGAIIEIVLASELNLDKSLTLDASPFRVRLNGGGAIRCARIAAKATVEIAAFEFVEGVADDATSNGGGILVSDGATLALNRCVICGCEASKNGGGIYVSDGATVALADSAIFGNRANSAGGGAYLALRSRFTANGSTLAGNVDAKISGVGGSSDVVAAYRFADAGFVAQNSVVCAVGKEYGQLLNVGAAVENGCVVGVAATRLGFAAFDADSVSFENWSRNAWQNIDLRLCDDQSDALSPYRDLGSVDLMSRYDLCGAFRGRERNGFKSCSPGAYETIQADLFWIGEPFPQELVDLAPQNLVASNFTVRDGAYSYVDVSWTLPDGADYSSIRWEYSKDGADFAYAATLSGTATSRTGIHYTGSAYVIRICGVYADGTRTAWSWISYAADAAVDDEDGGGQTTGTSLPSSLNVVAPTFLTSQGWATSRFATEFGDVAPQTGMKLFVDGVVNFVDVLSTSEAETFDFTIGGESAIEIDAASTTRIGTLQVGLGSAFTSPSLLEPITATRCGAWSRLNGSLVAKSPVDFDANSYVLNASYYGASVVSPTPIYGTLSVAASTSGVVRLSGEHVCSVFQVFLNEALMNATIKIDDGSSVVARVVNFGNENAANYVESFFDRPLTLKLYGAASLTTPSDAADGWADDVVADVSDATSADLTLNGQTVYGDAAECEITLNGAAKIDERGLTAKSLALSADSSLTLDGGTFRAQIVDTSAGSRIAGSGRVELASGSVWRNDGATVNGETADVYDVESNAVKITLDFDASEIRGACDDGVYRWTSPNFASGAICPIFSKYDNGDYQTIYDASVPVVDETRPVYETDADWNGETLKTVVDATPETGWNFYRVETPSFATVGGFSIYVGEQTPRYFVFCNDDSEPTPTLYYQGGASGSFATTSDWSLTSDGVAKFEGAPTCAGTVFVVERSAILRDFPSDARQISVAFPCVVEVYDAKGRRISETEARLVSVGVPAPSDPTFCVGNGGTAGVWTSCDGATLYRVEAVDGSASGVATDCRWLEPNETEVKNWRVRVAAPIYGGVENWSTETIAVQPFSALQEKTNYADATAGTTLELRYDENFAGLRDASIWRARTDDETSELIAQNFSGGEFTDVPETFGEYVYRVRWTPSPDNVWLETTAAPWFVADGFETTSQINFVTTPNRAYETPTFAARIAKKSNGELLKRQDVAKISYSLFENRDYWRTRSERLAVGTDGRYWRRDVEIPAATVRDSLLVDPNFWSQDEIGANFVFSPDDGRPFFPGPGSYIVRATIETTRQQRIVVDFPTQVE